MPSGGSQDAAALEMRGLEAAVAAEGDGATVGVAQRTGGGANDGARRFGRLGGMPRSSAVGGDRGSLGCRRLFALRFDSLRRLGERVAEDVEHIEGGLELLDVASGVGFDDRGDHEVVEAVQVRRDVADRTIERRPKLDDDVQEASDRFTAFLVLAGLATNDRRPGALYGGLKQKDQDLSGLCPFNLAPPIAG